MLFETRRDFIKTACQTFLGLTFLPNLGLSAVKSSDKENEIFAKRGSANSVIYLDMKGGQSHIDTWDPKSSNQVEGAVKAISTNVNGIQIGDVFPLTSKIVSEIAIIRSMTSREGNHQRGKYLQHTNYLPLGATSHASLGSWVLHTKGSNHPTLPGYVSIGRDNFNSGFLENQFNPLRIGNINNPLNNIKIDKANSEKLFLQRYELLTKLNALHKKTNIKNGMRHMEVDAYNEAYKMAKKIMFSKDLNAFDINKESKVTLKAYGENPFGKACVLARRLVEHKVRYVNISLNGWDDHNVIYENIPERCARLDRAYSALIRDLKSRGLLKTTLVVMGTEFGRTPTINARGGRNHHPKAFSTVLAGGNIQGGQVYGKTDDQGKEVIDKPTTVYDFNATIAYALGIDASKVKAYSADGRPFSFANNGKPITSLFI